MLSSKITVLIHFEAATKLEKLSEYITDGLVLLAIKPFKLEITPSKV